MRWWCGRGAAEIVVTVVWRAAAVLAGAGAFVEIATVGRRPYTAERLIDRLHGISDTSFAPSWLVDALRALVALLIAIAVAGVVAPARWRRWQAVLPVAGLVAVVVAGRGIRRTDWVSAGSWLDVVTVALAVAALASLVPVSVRRRRQASSPTAAPSRSA